MIFLQKIKTIISSTSIQYVSISYLSYTLTFVNSLLLANFLSVFFFGIYQFILLVSQYLSYSNLGISYSLGVVLAAKKNNPSLSSVVWHTAFRINLYCAIIIIISNIILITAFPNMMYKYNYVNHSLGIILIALISNANTLFSNLYRTYSCFFKINLQQFIPPASLLILIIVKQENTSIDDIIKVSIIGNLFPMIIYFYRAPLKLSLFSKIKKSIVYTLIRRGTTLLLHNLSFSFIIIASATIVSMFFAVEIFAQYRFAQSISSIAIMAISSFVFMFYSKILNRLTYKSNFEAESFIMTMNEVYVKAMDFVSFLLLIVCPIIQFGFEKYSPMLNVFKLLIVAKIITNQVSVYSMFMTARKKESYLAKYGFIAIGLVVILGLIVAWAGLQHEYVALSVVIASIYYSLRVLYKSTDMLNVISFQQFVLHIFNYRLIVPILSICVSAVMNEHLFTPILCVIMFFFLNYPSVKTLYIAGKKMIFDKSILEF